jgi:hypothetical protein
MTMACTIYEFSAPNSPHGMIQVVRLTNDLLDAQELLIDFPQRWLSENPHCIDLIKVTASNFIDARTQ